MKNIIKKNLNVSATEDYIDNLLSEKKKEKTEKPVLKLSLLPYIIVMYTEK